MYDVFSHISRDKIENTYMAPLRAVHVDIWSKIYLILYPFLLNLTTQIAIVCNDENAIQESLFCKRKT